MSTNVTGQGLSRMDRPSRGNSCVRTGAALAERALDLRHGLRCATELAAASPSPGTLASLARAWRAVASPLALAMGVGLLPGAGTVAAQGTLPTVSVSAPEESAEGETWVTFSVSLSAASEDWVDGRVRHVEWDGHEWDGLPGRLKHTLQAADL